MRLELVAKYIQPPKKGVLDEFWHAQLISEIREMAITGRPIRIFRRGQRPYRILDRISFGIDEIKIDSFDEKDVEDVELSQSIAYNSIVVEVPIYFADMSFGALCGSPNIAFAKVADEVKAVTGIGEGGLHPEVAKCKRFFVQWASARFGIDIEVLNKGIGVTIKIGQGAKPGIGGHLPGKKVTEIISMVRRIPPGTDALSPAPHHDIYSIEDLGQRIWALKEATGKPVFVKVAATNYIPYIVSGIARMGADGVIIDGHGAGTGATPTVVRDHIGIPLELAVASADAILRREGCREGFTIVASGRVSTADDAAKLIALGADMVSIGTAGLIAMGCIMCHKCNLGACPAGLASSLRDGSRVVDLEFAKERLKNFVLAFSRELKLILKHLGLKRLTDLRVRRDLLVGHNIDEETARLLGIKVVSEEPLPPKHEEDVWLPKYREYVRRLAETGDVVVVGQGSNAPPEVERPKRLIDWLRVDGAQVTRPSIDPYREHLDLEVMLCRGMVTISEPIIVRAYREIESYVNELAFAAHLMGTLCDVSGLSVMPSRHLSHVISDRPHERVRMLSVHVDKVDLVEEVEGKHVYVRVAASLDVLSQVEEVVGKHRNRVCGIIVDEELRGSRDDVEVVLVRLDKMLRRMRVRYEVDVITHMLSVRDAGDIVKLIALGSDAVEISRIVGVAVEGVGDRGVLVERVVKLLLGLKREVALISGAAGVYSIQSSLVGNRELLRSLDLDPRYRRELDVKLAGSW